MPFENADGSIAVGERRTRTVSIVIIHFSFEVRARRAKINEAIIDDGDNKDPASTQLPMIQ